MIEQGRILEGKTDSASRVALACSLYAKYILQSNVELRIGWVDIGVKQVTFELEIKWS